MASGIFYQPGEYVCSVVQQGLSEAGTGNPQFVLRVKVIGRPDPDTPGNVIVGGMQQLERTYYRTITDKSIEWFMQELDVLGFTGTSFKQLDPSSPQHQSFVGSDIDMICEHEADQSGQPRERWKIKLQGGGGEIKPLDAAKARQLDNLFGKHLQARKSAAPAAAKRTASAVAVADDFESL